MSTTAGDLAIRGAASDRTGCGVYRIRPVSRPNIGPGSPAVSAHRATDAHRRGRATLRRCRGRVARGPPSVMSCPPNRRFIDELLFHAVSGHTISVVTNAGGCPFVAVTVDGVRQPDLYGSVDTQVLAELELPASYG